MNDKEAFQRGLDQRQPLLDRARGQLERRLIQLTEDMSKVRNLRPRLVEARLKTAEELQKKASERGWTVNQAFELAGDVIGARIVCNNTMDVWRMRDCILECPDLEAADAEIEDYISIPKESGYRSLHLPVSIRVPKENTSEEVTCEVQIRTVMQDAWATVAHDDYYKNPDAPESVTKFFPVLAQQLDAAQQIADLLREQLEVKAPAEKSAVNAAEPISPSNIGALYASLFDDSLSWAELSEVATVAEEHHIETVQEVLKVLSVPETRERLAKALRNAEGEPSNLGLLIAGSLVGRYGFEDGFAKYVLDYVGVESLEGYLGDVIRYCPTCQPYDGGMVWVLGKRLGAYDEVVREAWFDLFEEDAPGDINEIVAALNLSCPNCGAELDAGSEVGGPDD